MKKVRPHVDGSVIFSEPLLDAVLRLTDPEVDSEKAALSAVARAMRLGDLVVGWLDPRDWQAARDWLIHWLPRIRTYRTAKRVGREALERELNRLIFADPVQVEVSRGDLELHIPRTMCGACGLAVLPFLLRNGWSPERLAKCRNRRCGRWFLRPLSQRGTAAEYCSSRHAGSERSARSRDKAAGRRPSQRPAKKKLP